MIYPCGMANLQWRFGYVVSGHIKTQRPQCFLLMIEIVDKMGYSHDPSCFVASLLVSWLGSSAL